MIKLTQAVIRFPDIRLQQREGHKLRGYFANLFKDRSDLFHNYSLEDGQNIYRYPLIQYKVIDKIPMLIGLNDGAVHLINIFLQTKELRIGENIYPVLAKNIEKTEVDTGVCEKLIIYGFKSPWFALNQTNFRKYSDYSPEQKKIQLEQILKQNILSFFKGIQYFEKERILVKLNIAQHQTKFKDIEMIAFKGSFTGNLILPDYIGFGKSVARGFGCIKRIE